MTKVICKRHDGYTTYTTFDGEHLFQGSVEPRNYWNSWFTRVKRVEFSTDAGTFVIHRFAFNKDMEISQGNALFGKLRYRGRDGVALLRIDGTEVVAFIPGGSPALNLTYECHDPDGVTLFNVCVPTFWELFTASVRLDSRNVFLVGEIDRESLKDPAVAILFMFIEMFLDRGGPPGA